jgi:hypothetical protein
MDIDSARPHKRVRFALARILLRRCAAAASRATRTTLSMPHTIWCRARSQLTLV